MQNNDKVTFGEDEKKILEILSYFEEELNNKLQDERGEVERIKYYEKFQINGMDFNNIFISTEKDVDGNISYHVYCGDVSNELININSKGEITIIEELKKFLGDIDIESIIDENEKEPNRLKAISQKIKPEEIKDIFNSQKEEEQNSLSEENVIEQDLQEQGQDLGISNFREIKDKSVAQRMPEVFGSSDRSGIAYSNRLNRFVMISKNDGKYKLNDNVKPAQFTWKSIISIDENGEKVERKVPHALMKTNDSEKEVAVTIGQYGYVDIETVDRLPSNERIARGVRTSGEGKDKEEAYEIRREFETSGKQYKKDLAQNVQNIERVQKETTGQTDYDITEDDYIPNTDKTWGDLMDETGESLTKLIERYNREMSKDGVKPDKVVQIIEEDYENISHQQKR